MHLIVWRMLRLNEDKTTYTSPSGVYLEPEISKASRSTWSPSTDLIMNIWGGGRTESLNYVQNCAIDKPQFSFLSVVPTLVTHIWLVVRVPVLSEQMTEVQPRVSTEGRLLTIAFFLAIRRVPRARQVVMTAGRPERCWGKV